MLAFCEDVAASGGYWLACAADEIYAHPTSIVGSIGVISQGFGLDGLIAAVRRASGGSTPRATSKSRLDPFLPEKPEDVEWLRGLQDQLHEMFRDWVRGPPRRPPHVGRRAVQRRGVDRRPGGRDGPDRRARHRARRARPSASPTPSWCRSKARRPLLARLGIGAAPAAAKRASRSCRAVRPGGRDPRDMGTVRSVARSAGRFRAVSDRCTALALTPFRSHHSRAEPGREDHRPAARPECRMRRSWTVTTTVAAWSFSR